MNQRFYASLIAIGCIGGIAVVARQCSDSASASNAAGTTVRAEGRSLQTRLVLSGILAPSRVVEIRAESSGVVQEVLVVRGQRVAKGQVLARLKSDQALAEFHEADIAVAEAELALEKSRIEMSDVSLDLAQANARRQHSLFKEGLVARATVETADSEVRMAEIAARVRGVSVASAEKAVERARAKQKKARAVLDATVMKAPLDGYVLQLPVSEGSSMSALLTSGDTDEGKILVAAADNLLFVAKVPPGQLSRLEVGQLASVTVRGSARVLRARVSFLPLTAETDSTGVAFFPVELQVLDVTLGEALLNTDASAEVVATVYVSVSIPLKCLHYDEQGAPYVVGVSGVRRPLETLRSSEQYIEVTNGLAVGDEIRDCGLPGRP